MSGPRYVVQQGDSLSALAGRFLADIQQWPGLLEHNNSPAVTALTKTKIVDPDLIFVGQVLYIPEVDSGPPPPSAQPPSARPTPPSASKKRAFGQVRGIPFKYSLDLLPQLKHPTLSGRRIAFRDEDRRLSLKPQNYRF